MAGKGAEILLYGEVPEAFSEFLNSLRAAGKEWMLVNLYGETLKEWLL